MDGGQQFYIDHMEVNPIVFVSECEVLVGKETLNKMLSAFLWQEADGPICSITDEVHASDLGEYAKLIRIQAGIAEEFETLSTLQFEAIVVQPG
jgi:hypothetical protein